MTNSLVIRRCATLSEALVCNSFLQSNEVLSSLDNEHHSANDWFAVAALGGVQIRVPTAQYDQARQLIVERHKFALEILSDARLNVEPIEKRRYWRAASMLFIWLGFLHVLMVFGLLALDTLIPANMLPHPDLLGAAIGPSMGYATLSVGLRADGLAIIFFIGLIVFWELITTAETENEKDTP